MYAARGPPVAATERSTLTKTTLAIRPSSALSTWRDKEFLQIIMNSAVFSRNGRRVNKGSLGSNHWANLATLKPHVPGDKLYEVRVLRVLRVVLFQRIISGYQLERDDQASFSFRGHSSSAPRSTHAGPIPRGSRLTARGSTRSLTFHIINKYITHLTS